MSALPADVARYTSDGVVVSTDKAIGDAIKAAHSDAQDLGTGEIEMFFDDPADAAVLLNERFAYLSQIGPIHEGIEVEENLGLGSAISITPSVPKFRIVDESRLIDTEARVRAFARDMTTDRYSVEVLG